MGLSVHFEQYFQQKDNQRTTTDFGIFARKTIFFVREQKNAKMMPCPNYRPHNAAKKKSTLKIALLNNFPFPKI